MNFATLTAHVKADEQTFNFKEPVTVKGLSGEEDKVYSTYTLNKLSAIIEKKIVNFFSQDKKGTIYDILAGNIIRLDDNEVKRAEVSRLLRQVPEEVIENIFVNLRVLTYGSEVKVNFKCENMVYQKGSDNRYIRDSNDKIVLGPCGVENESIITIDSNFYKDDEEYADDKAWDNTVVMPLQNEGIATFYVKPMFNIELERMLISKLSDKQKESYSLELTLLSMIESIDVTIDGETSSFRPTVNSFFNKDGSFVPDSPKAKEFLDFFKIIPLGIRDEIKSKSKNSKIKRSEFKLSYKATCKSCKGVHEGTLNVVDSGFLLPGWGK